MQFFFHITTLFLLFLVVYHHLIYPLIMKWVQTYHNKNVINKSVLKLHDLPDISIILPAYNEAGYIADKIRNIAMLTYPKEKLYIILASDGSSDQTIDIAKKTLEEPECQHLNISIKDFKQNRGKVAIINELILKTKTPLIAVSDISAIISMDALLIGANRLNDDNVGVVTGHYQLLHAGSEGEKMYWQYQSAIKQSESLVHSTMGVHGAFYMFKREYFNLLEKDTINDDFILPMKIVEQGYRAIYEPLIHILEIEKVTTEQDIARRKRISAGNMQQFLRLKRLVLPRYGRVAFMFISGKVLRVLMPFILLLILLLSLYLASLSLYWLLILVIQSFIYGFAGFIHLFQPKNNVVGNIIYYLVSGHVANFKGAWRYLMGKETGRWDRVV